MLSALIGVLLVGVPYSVLVMGAAIGRDRFLRLRARRPENPGQ